MSVVPASFLAIAGDAARVAFSQLADAATLTPPGGAPVATRCAIDRSYQDGSHLGQPRLVAKLPLDVGTVVRGAQLLAEGCTFTVVQEIDRDQFEIQLLVREVA